MTNVDSAKLFFGIVLNQLQHSFPAAVFLSSENLWPAFEKAARGGTVSIKTPERWYRTLPIEDLNEDKAQQEHYTKMMLRWMAKEGYLVSDPASNFPYDYILSSKALAALNIAFEDDKKTVGEMLASAALKAGDAANSELISRLVSKIFDSFQGLIS